MAGSEQGSTGPQKGSFSWILGLALFFLAIVLTYSAVAQFRLGRLFSAAVGALGAVLFFGVDILLLIDHLRRRHNHPKEDHHG